jgi:hypothetical protein
MPAPDTSLADAVLKAMEDFDTTALVIKAVARDLVARSAALGYVVTIEQVPRTPLAMGNYETVVSVRPARSKS